MDVFNDNVQSNWFVMSLNEYDWHWFLCYSFTLLLLFDMKCLNNSNKWNDTMNECDRGYNELSDFVFQFIYKQRGILYKGEDKQSFCLYLLFRNA